MAFLFVSCIYLYLLMTHGVFLFIFSVEVTCFIYVMINSLFLLAFILFFNFIKTGIKLFFNS